MDKIQAYDNFWYSFGWDAYDETSVPDNAALPYITYELATDYFDNTLALTASLWSRSTSWTDITAKAEQISEYIGRGGKLVPFQNGAIWIKRGTPWAQRMSDASDDMVRRIVLNIQAEYIENAKRTLVGSKWEFKANPVLPSPAVTYQINYIWEQDNYIRIRFASNSIDFQGAMRIETIMFPPGWENHSRAIQITGGQDVENLDLINYLKNNATEIKE